MGKNEFFFLDIGFLDVGLFLGNLHLKNGIFSESLPPNPMKGWYFNFLCGKISQSFPTKFLEQEEAVLILSSSPCHTCHTCHIFDISIGNSCHNYCINWFFKIRGLVTFIPEACKEPCHFLSHNCNVYHIGLL